MRCFVDGNSISSGPTTQFVECVCCATQFWMFSISGERLTMRLRHMVFKALLRQVLYSFSLTVCYVLSATF